MVRTEHQTIKTGAILYEEGNRAAIDLSIAGQNCNTEHLIGGDGWYTIPAHRSAIIINDQGGNFLTIGFVRLVVLDQIELAVIHQVTNNPTILRYISEVIDEETDTCRTTRVS
jgi:hypothetical protein